MKQITLISILLTTLLTTNSWARTRAADIVNQVVAAVQQQPVNDPNALQAQEIEKLLSEIMNQGLVTSEEISISDLTHPGDAKAIETAKDFVSHRMQKAIASLAAIKNQVIRYAVLSGQAGDLATSRTTQLSLAESTRQKIQDFYEDFIKQLVLERKDRKPILDRCLTDICVLTVNKSFDELTIFGQGLDWGLNFEKLHADTQVFWRFENPLLKDSFSKAFRKMVAPNQEVSIYRALLGGIYAPLSVVGSATVGLVKQVLSLSNARFVWKTINAQPAYSGKGYKWVHNENGHLLTRQLLEVSLDTVGSNSRIKSYDIFVAACPNGTEEESWAFRSVSEFYEKRRPLSEVGDTMTEVACKLARPTIVTCKNHEAAKEVTMEVTYVKRFHNGERCEGGLLKQSLLPEGVETTEKFYLFNCFFAKPEPKSYCK